MAALHIPNSTEPLRYLPLRMSAVAGMGPMRTGQPGCASWVSASPASCSAFNWASIPAIVTGAVEPAIGAAESTTGTRCRQHSISSVVTPASNLSGLTIQLVMKETMGRSRNGLEPPEMRSHISTTSRMPWMV